MLIFLQFRRRTGTSPSWSRSATCLLASAYTGFQAPQRQDINHHISKRGTLDHPPRGGKVRYRFSAFWLRSSRVRASFSCLFLDSLTCGAAPLPSGMMDAVHDEAGLDPRSDGESLYEDVSEGGDTVFDLPDTYASRTAFGLPALDGDRLFTDLERDNFHPDNVTPNRPCTAFFRPSTYHDAKDIFDALEREGFPPNTIRCLQRKPSGEIFVTFCNPDKRNEFLRRSSFIVRRSRYTTNDEDSSVLFLTVYDAPHELPDTAIITRLLEYCSVVSQRRGKHHSQPTVFNGLRHYRIQLKRNDVTVPSYLRFGKFLLRFSHAGQTRTCRKCNRSGHLAATCKNILCFNCDELGHVARECPNAMLCCLCKSSGHLAKTCPAAWIGLIARPGRDSENDRREPQEPSQEQDVIDETTREESSQEHDVFQTEQSNEMQSQLSENLQHSDEMNTSLPNEDSQQQQQSSADTQSSDSVSYDPGSQDPSGEPSGVLDSGHSGALDSRGLIKDRAVPAVPARKNRSVPRAPVFDFLSPVSLPASPASGDLSSSAASVGASARDASESSPSVPKSRTPLPSGIPLPQRGNISRRKPAPVAEIVVARRPTRPTHVPSGKSAQKTPGSSADSTGTEEPMDSSETRKRKKSDEHDDSHGKQAPT